MRRSKKILGETFLLLLIFAILGMPVFSEQPSLPTTIYGLVLDQLEKPESGILVTVTWTNEDGKLSSQSRKTLTLKEAEALGNKNWEGQYFFNEGFVKAKPNTEIRIAINGFDFDKINSNPGGIIRARDAVLYPISGASSTIATPVSESLSNGGGEGTGSDPTYPVSGQLGTSSNANSDISSSYSKAEPSEKSTADYGPSTPSFSLPTGIIGQLLDENNKPIGDETVYAKWTDDKGEEHIETAKTLTKDEARKLGNKSLEGFYQFNNGSIRAKPGTNIILRTVKGNSTEIKSNPGNLTKARPLLSPSGSTMSAAQKKPFFSGNSFGKTILNAADEIRKDKRWFFALVVLFAIFVFISYRHYKKKIKPKVRNQLYRNMDSFGSGKVKHIMSKKPIAVEKETSVAETLGMLIDKNLNSIIITSNKTPIGIVSESDFLKKVYTKDQFEKLKAKDIMSSPLKIIEGGIKIFECIGIMAKTGYRKLGVVKGSQLTGIVTATDIIREIDRFFSRNIIDSYNVPIAGSIMDKKVISIGEEMRLSEVCSYMIWKKMSVCLVEKKANSDVKKISIITTKDIINMFYKNQYTMYKLKAKQLTLSPIIYVTPGTNLFDVLKLMVAKNVRRVPVVMSNKVVGIINQNLIIEALYHFMRDTMKLIEKMELNAEHNEEQPAD